MPISLREPFFLRGRRSVAQRAVVMSLVLGGLAMLASWLMYGVVISMVTLRVEGWVASILATTAGVASILLVYGPLSYWNRRPWWFIGFVVPVSVALTSLAATTIIQTTISPDDPGFLGLTAGMVLLMGGIGIVMLRRSRAHLMAFIASVLTAPVAALQMSLIQNYDVSSAPLGMVPMVQTMILVSMYATILFGLSVPWGIPFWWPPSAEQTESTLQRPASASEAG